jgi:hypothetical protein
MLMTKTYLFDSFLTALQLKKLSKSGGRTHCNQIGSSTADWYLVQLKKTSTRDTKRCLSKQALVFERDSRKVSSLTTRIGQAHFSGRELVLNEYAKEARGLSMLISTHLLST